MVPFASTNSVVGMFSRSIAGRDLTLLVEQDVVADTRLLDDLAAALLLLERVDTHERHFGARAAADLLEVGHLGHARRAVRGKEVHDHRLPAIVGQRSRGAGELTAIETVEADVRHRFTGQVAALQLARIRRS